MQATFVHPYALPDDRHATDDVRRIDYLPTPGEIHAACAEIRSTWSRSEKRRRFVGDLVAEDPLESAWRPPVIDTSHFRLLASRGVDVSA